jgi:radical SAM superfamily enzyme YgiQ (UPF0313 family)
MPRILLVKASSRGFIPDLCPPLGVMYLAAVLRERTRHEVRILDARLYGDGLLALRKALSEYRPDLVGISAISFEHHGMAELAAQARRWKQGLPNIVGGPHATALPHLVLSETGADAAVVGEGEDVIAPLVEAMLSGEGVPGLKGVVAAGSTSGPGPADPAPAPELEDLPLPAWDLVDLGEYHRRMSASSFSPWRYAVMVTSRGCPWRCSFCHNVHGKKYRVRSLASIGAELALFGRLLKRGHVEIMDDNFNLDGDRANSILEMFCRTGGSLRPCFSSGLRPDRIDGTMLDMLQRSRTALVSFAVESGSPRMQKLIGKNVALDAAGEAMRGAAGRGLYTNGFFMLGFPGETREDMLETIKFACGSPLTQALFFRVLSCPGSKIWLERGAPGSGEGDDRGLDFFSFRGNLSGIPEREFRAVMRHAYTSFYFNPRRLLGLAGRYPSILKLSRRALAMARLLLR